MKDTQAQNVKYWNVNLTVAPMEYAEKVNVNALKDSLAQHAIHPHQYQWRHSAWILCYKNKVKLFISSSKTFMI